MELWRTTHLLFLSIVISLNSENVQAHCIDLNSNIVSQGLHYVPGTNPCTVCICDKGSPKWCKSVLCSAPQNCKSFQVGNTCCEFKCLDDILTGTDGYKETYDVALRFIASAVTAVLSLSLLFFLFHRLRRRKLLLHRQNQQISDDQRSLSSIGYIAGSLGYLPESYLSSGNNELEFHYEDASAHYSLWKPPGNYFPRGEAPPPYEEAVRSAQLEHQQHTDLINTQLRTASNTILNSITSVPRLNGGVATTGGTAAVTVAAVSVSGNVGTATGNLIGNAGRNVTTLTTLPNIQPQQESGAVLSAPVNSSISSTTTTQCRHDNFTVLTNANVCASAAYHPLQSSTAVTLNPTNVVIAATTSNNQYVNISVNNDGGQVQQVPEEQRATCSTKSATQQTIAVLRKVRAAAVASEHAHEKAYENVPYSKSNRASQQREIRQPNPPNKGQRESQGGRLARDDRHHVRYENISNDKKHNVAAENSKIESRSGHHHARSRQQQQQQQHLKNSRSQDNLRKVDSNIVSSTNGSTFRILDGYKNIEVIRSKDTMIITEGVLPKQPNCAKSTPTPKREDFYENTRSHPQHQQRINMRDNANYSTTTSRKHHHDLNMSLRKSVPNNQIRDITTPLHRTLPKNVSELLARSEETILDNPSTSGQNGGKLLLGSWRDSSGDAPVSSKSHGNLTSVACGSAPSAAEQLRSKCLVSYHCLSSSQDDDDYRSECENCKSAGMITSESEEMDVLNETMTLQRRLPLEQQQGEEVPYYRTSLTLPANTRKPRYAFQ